MTSTRLCLIVCVMFAFALAVLPEASAQTIWNGGTGNWSDAANWSTGIVPNGSTVDVRIDNGNSVASIVTFDLLSGSVGDLILDPDDTLLINGALTSYFATLASGTLKNYGSFSNGGLLNNYGTLNNGDSNFLQGTLNNSGTLNNYGTLLNIHGTVSNYGTFNNSGSFRTAEFGVIPSDVSNYGTFNNSGSFAIGLLGHLVNFGTIDNHGEMSSDGAVNISSGVLNNYGTLDIEEYEFSNGATLNNFGVLTISGFGGRFGASGATNNFGTLNNGGRLNNSGVMTNFGTLNNQSFLTNSGIFKNFGTTYNSDDGNLVNYGLFSNSGVITNSGGLNNYNFLTNSGIFKNFGRIYNRDGGYLENEGLFSNSGTVLVASGAVLVNDSTQHSLATYTQSAGSTVVDGRFISDTPIQINGGMLSGAGVIQGDVIMGGTASPGDSLGILSIHGNYAQLATGQFREEIAGFQVGTEYDQLGVVGAAFLDGFLDVTLLNGFVPAIGSTFEIMSFTPGELTGTFAGINGIIDQNERWIVIYDNQNGFVELEAAPTPEPSSFLLLGSGLLGLAGMLRRRLVG